ncbi:TraB/GumN family protein [uncultured Phenylobacterium sp.]|uniref:TraB/GumN family protein n=1 Tax=uncultured Phenylobacterium sp. TaxID=349273 RepID=UPI0025F069F0|nr:TraB/GumN family protein [uncultured Phenylobacterium sp.]
MRRLAAAAGAILVGWLGGPSLFGGGDAAAAPALWRVSDADSRIYLFGTLHVLSPKAQWRTPLYDRVLEEAGAVWFEADLTRGDPETVRLLFRRYGSDPDVPLSRKLPPADVQALARQTDLARIEHLRPWAAALMLSVRPSLGRGATVEAGADMAATRAARAGGKTIRAFETLEDQARMYASLPQAAEIRYLSKVVRERARRRITLPPGPVTLERAWLAGDLSRLGSSALEADNPALYDALLRRRNLAWADRLAAEMAGGGTQLVNVGALHMAGDDGLPALMAARGFTVERVQ